jgi:hypothetical protein
MNASRILLPPLAGALVLLAAGASFLFVANRARRTGELPAGRSGFRPFRPRRDESPGAFYFFQTLYTVFGAGLVIYGVLMALGLVAPLPLR